MSQATVSRVLRRLGLNRLHTLEPAQPIRRYERAVDAMICSTNSRHAMGDLRIPRHRIRKIEARKMLPCYRFEFRGGPGLMVAR